MAMALSRNPLIEALKKPAELADESFFSSISKAVFSSRIETTKRHLGLYLKVVAPRTGEQRIKVNPIVPPPRDGRITGPMSLPDASGSATTVPTYGLRETLRQAFDTDQVFAIVLSDTFNMAGEKLAWFYEKVNSFPDAFAPYFNYLLAPDNEHKESLKENIFAQTEGRSEQATQIVFGAMDKVRDAVLKDLTSATLFSQHCGKLVLRLNDEASMQLSRVKAGGDFELGAVSASEKEIQTLIATGKQRLDLGMGEHARWWRSRASNVNAFIDVFVNSDGPHDQSVCKALAEHYRDELRQYCAQPDRQWFWSWFSRDTTTDREEKLSRISPYLKQALSASAGSVAQTSSTLAGDALARCLDPVTPGHLLLHHDITNSDDFHACEAELQQACPDYFLNRAASRVLESTSLPSSPLPLNGPADQAQSDVWEGAYRQMGSSPRSPGQRFSTYSGLTNHSNSTPVYPYNAEINAAGLPEVDSPRVSSQWGFSPTQHAREFHAPAPSASGASSSHAGRRLFGSERGSSFTLNSPPRLERVVYQSPLQQFANCETLEKRNALRADHERQGVSKPIELALALQQQNQLTPCLDGAPGEMILAAIAESASPEEWAQLALPDFLGKDQATWVGKDMTEIFSHYDDLGPDIQTPARNPRPHSTVPHSQQTTSSYQSESADDAELERAANARLDDQGSVGSYKSEGSSAQHTVSSYGEGSQRTPQTAQSEEVDPVLPSDQRSTASYGSEGVGTPSPQQSTGSYESGSSHAALAPIEKSDAICNGTPGSVSSYQSSSNGGSSSGGLINRNQLFQPVADLGSKIKSEQQQQQQDNDCSPGV